MQSGQNGPESQRNVFQHLMGFGPQIIESVLRKNMVHPAFSYISKYFSPQPTASEVVGGETA